VSSSREDAEGTHLIAVGFPSAQDADRALALVRRLADEKRLTLKDAAVVVKSGHDHVELRQTHQSTLGDSAVGGGTIGLLVGLLVGLPIAGALAGIGGGGGLAAIDRGISDDRMRRFGKELAPGHAALFALVADVDWAALRERLAPLGGTFAVSQLDAAVVAALAGESAGP
jgi:uncharacterized membrane protein